MPWSCIRPKFYQPSTEATIHALFSLLVSKYASPVPIMNIQLNPMWCRVPLTLIFVAAMMIGISTNGAQDLSPDVVGLNYRAWTKGSTRGIGALDQTAGDNSAKPQRVIELRTGMNYSKDGTLVASEAWFDEEPNSFSATRMQHKVKLSKNLYTARAVTIDTRDGITLKSTPSAIGLYDTASGRSAIIAALTNSVGVQVQSNRVVFPNAYSGLCADVVYTVNLESFEQDVVIAEHFAPRDYDFPDKTTLIQIYTEFFDAVAEPERIRRPIRVEQDKEVRAARVMPDLVDEVLGFGEFVLATGRAMSTGEQDQGRYMSGAPVAKQLIMIGSRRFLVESVDYSLLQGQLDALPECQHAEASGQSLGNGKRTKLYASVPPEAPGYVDETYEPKKLLAVQDSLTRRAGVIIDYIATVGSTLSTAYTFQGDATYLITGPVVANGPITLEGGAVIKYKHLSPATASIKMVNSFFCKTSRYRPAFCTAVDDDSVGESMYGYANSGYTTPTHSIYTDGYANPALWFSYSGGKDVNHVRYRYCQEALRFEGPQASNVRHSQLVNCIRGIVISGTGSGSGTFITCENILMAGVQFPLKVDFPNSTVNLHNATIDGVPAVSTLVSTSVSTTCSIVNGIVANITTLSSGAVTLSGNFNGFVGSVPLFGNTVNRWQVSDSAFQAQLAGNYYLPPTSLFRDKGTTAGLAATLIAELKKTTTDAPPPALSGTIGALLTLSPSLSAAQGDADTPNLGYHYPILNAVLNNVSLAARLILTNGVAVGLQSAAVDVNPGGHLCSEGSALTLNSVVSLANVQEQSTGSPNPSFIRLNSTSGLPELEFRFTDFSIGQGQSAKYVDTGVSGDFGFSHLTFKDSRLRNPSLTIRPSTLSTMRFALTNCLVEGGNLIVALTAGSVNTSVAVYLYNNTFLNNPASAAPGTPPALALTYDNGASLPDWTMVVKDNLFNKASQSLTGSGMASVVRGYNGFTTGTVNSFGVSSGDQIAFSLTYINGTLGEYYLPSTATALIDKGSRLADAAGLYHYTTLNLNTAESKELFSSVDIGFHYVALGSTALAFDQDNDGLADYLEDRDGNYVYGTGDPSSWLLSDTDGDGISDSVELARGLDPKTKQSDLMLVFPTNF